MTTRLPVVGSTAATTTFCHERLDGPGDLHLFLDGNGKITAGNGTLASPRPNALSLRNVNDCPQSTPTCRAACYVENLRAAQPDLYAMYEHNATTIRTILADPALAGDWAARLGAWIVWNAAGGFRFHVSGDVISMEHARWIADVCRACAPVVCWIYTRSFDFLEPLVQVSTQLRGNLALNLSCDADNYAAAVAASRRYFYVPDEDDLRLRLCYLTTDGALPADLPLDSTVFPDYRIRPRQFPTLAESPWWQTLTPDQRAMCCPVDAHGKSEKRRCGIPGGTGCSRCTA